MAHLARLGVCLIVHGLAEASARGLGGLAAAWMVGFWAVVGCPAHRQARLVVAEVLRRMLQQWQL